MIAPSFCNHFKFVMRPRIPYVTDQPQIGGFDHDEVAKTHALHSSGKDRTNSRSVSTAQFNSPLTEASAAPIAIPGARFRGADKPGGWRPCPSEFGR